MFTVKKASSYLFFSTQSWSKRPHAGFLRFSLLVLSIYLSFSEREERIRGLEKRKKASHQPGKIVHYELGVVKKSHVEEKPVSKKKCGLKNLMKSTIYLKNRLFCCLKIKHFDWRSGNALGTPAGHCPRRPS